MADESILELLHKDHEEAEELIDQIIDEQDGAERAALFAKLREELIAHLEAEAKVLYARLEKQRDNEEGHDFALEGAVEHELVEQQLEVLGRSRNKGGEDWTARMEVVRDMVRHHVEQEEDEGHQAARELFDEPTLVELGEEFTAAKERMMSGGAARGGTRKAAARAYAGSKPRSRTTTQKKGRTRKKAARR